MNVSDEIFRHASQAPDRMALVDVEPRENVTYGELTRRAARFRAGLRERNIGRGDRVVVMISPGADLFALTIAILAEGGVAAFIEPGRGLGALVETIRDADASLLVVRRRTALAQWLLPDLWSSQLVVRGEGFGPFGGLDAWKELEPVEERVADVDDEDPAMIRFSADGPIAPLRRSHRALRDASWAELVSVGDDEVGCSVFPTIGFEQLRHGMTTVLPPVDVRRPADADAPRVVRAWRNQGVTMTSGPPALFENIVDYLEDRDRVVETIRHIVIAGAPVSRRLARRMMQRFPEARRWAVYGPAPDAPVCRVRISEIADSPTRGYLVGSPIDEESVRIVEPLTDHQVACGDVRGYRVTSGTIGELVVAAGDSWRRTDDLARRDERGIWLVGRAANLVRVADETIAPFEVEHSMTRVTGLTASALVQGPSGPVLFYAGPRGVRSEIRDVLRDHRLADVELRRIPTIPRDSRYQSQVDRAALRRSIWNPATIAAH